MKSNTLKSISVSTLIALTIGFGSFQIQAFGQESAVHIQIPGVTSTVSNRVIAYHGSSNPGYTTIVVKTDQPSRGHINVYGGSTTARINLSTTDFKTEHVIHWSPWDDAKRAPLAPGEYVLKMDLSYANGNRDTGVGLGSITVVAEPNPKALIEKVSPRPTVISPKHNSTLALTTVDYTLNRHAEVQVVIQRNGQTQFSTAPIRLAPGVHNFTWNGRDNNGAIVQDGDYTITFRTVELNFNHPDTRPVSFNLGTIKVQGGEYGIPQGRLEQIVTGGGFDSNVVSPNGDGVQDTVGGSITLSQRTKVTVWITNAAGAHMKDVIPSAELEAGTHNFIWDGRDFMGGSAINGKYMLKVSVVDKDSSLGDLFIPGAEVTVKESTQITVPQPVETVRVTKPTAAMQVYPMNQGYTAKEGDVFPILQYHSSNNQYEVLVKDSVPGFINASDVAKVGAQPQPQPQPSPNPIIHTVAPGESLWVISRNYGVSIDAIARANNLDANRHLMIGDQLVIPSQSTGTPVQPVQPTQPKPVAPVTPPVETTPSNEVIHLVVAGDTLWKIAQQYKTTVDAIANHNKLNPSNHLVIGQKIAIPSAQATTPVDNNQNNSLVYTVKSGDTLWRIAQAHGTTVDNIVKANNLDVTKHLMVGQQLVIPGQSTPVAPQPVMYTVKAGDTLWKIAQAHGTTVDNIVSLSKINPNNHILVGQQLRVK